MLRKLHSSSNRLMFSKPNGLLTMRQHVRLRFEPGQELSSSIWRAKSSTGQHAFVYCHVAARTRQQQLNLRVKDFNRSAHVYVLS